MSPAQKRISFPKRIKRSKPRLSITRGRWVPTRSQVTSVVFNHQKVMELGQIFLRKQLAQSQVEQRARDYHNALMTDLCRTMVDSAALLSTTLADVNNSVNTCHEAITVTIEEFKKDSLRMSNFHDHNLRQQDQRYRLQQRNLNSIMANLAEASQAIQKSTIIPGEAASSMYKSIESFLENQDKLAQWIDRFNTQMLPGANTMAGQPPMASQAHPEPERQHPRTPQAHPEPERQLLRTSQAHPEPERQPQHTFHHQYQDSSSIPTYDSFTSRVSPDSYGLITNQFTPVYNADMEPMNNLRIVLSSDESAPNKMSRQISYQQDDTRITLNTPEPKPSTPPAAVPPTPLTTLLSAMPIPKRVQLYIIDTTKEPALLNNPHARDHTERYRVHIDVLIDHLMEENKKTRDFLKQFTTRLPPGQSRTFKQPLPKPFQHITKVIQIPYNHLHEWIMRHEIYYTVFQQQHHNIDRTHLPAVNSVMFNHLPITVKPWLELHSRQTQRPDGSFVTQGELCRGYFSSNPEFCTCPSETDDMIKVENMTRWVHSKRLRTIVQATSGPFWKMVFEFHRSENLPSNCPILHATYKTAWSALRQCRC